MRIPLILLIIAAIICPAIDIYIGRAILCLVVSPRRRRFASIVHIVITAIAYVILLAGLLLPRTGGEDSTLVVKMWLLFTFLTIYLPKALFVIIDLLASIPALFRRRRWRPVEMAGGVLSIILFLAMWHAALVNRFRIQIREVEVPVRGLPEAFDGYRIIQLSDIHSGTYGRDTTFLHKLVERTNALCPDLIAFTGDIVNRHTDEIIPHAPTLSRLSARDGVLAILGNHDYGDYYSWDSPAQKAASMERLYQVMDSMGWRLLRNQTAILRLGTDSLPVIGVENIGDPPFPTYGSLARAYPAGADGVPKILLSHNPAHWNDSISHGVFPNDIALTLSGHTHAMQIELLGLSPAVFRYPQWGGLYNDGQGRYLYVNIGTGTVGLPMRLGATPEITVITLRRRD